MRAELAAWQQAKALREPKTAVDKAHDENVPEEVPKANAKVNFAQQQRSPGPPAEHCRGTVPSSPLREVTPGPGAVARASPKSPREVSRPWYAGENTEIDIPDLKESMVEDCLQAFEEYAAYRVPPNSPDHRSPATAAAWSVMAPEVEAQAAALPKLLLEAAIEEVAGVPVEKLLERCSSEAEGEADGDAK